jgi:hypothetical protein
MHSSLVMLERIVAPESQFKSKVFPSPGGEGSGVGLKKTANNENACGFDIELYGLLF